MEKLPVYNYNLLKYLIEFLNLVRHVCLWYISMVDRILLGISLFRCESNDNETIIISIWIDFGLVRWCIDEYIEQCNIDQ
jgi:hypothetical protein